MGHAKSKDIDPYHAELNMLVDSMQKMADFWEFRNKLAKTLVEHHPWIWRVADKIPQTRQTNMTIQWRPDRARARERLRAITDTKTTADQQFLTDAEKIILTQIYDYSWRNPKVGDILISDINPVSLI